MVNCRLACTAVEENCWHNTLFDWLYAINYYYNNVLMLNKRKLTAKTPVISVAGITTQAEEETTKIEKFCFKPFYLHCKLGHFEWYAFYCNKKKNGTARKYSRQSELWSGLLCTRIGGSVLTECPALCIALKWPMLPLWEPARSAAACFSWNTCHRYYGYWLSLVLVIAPEWQIVHFPLL